MFRNLLFIFLLSLFGTSTFVSAQGTVNVININRTGNFLSCSGSVPVITASLVNSEGSTVINGKVVVTDPCGFTTLKITMSNLKYNQPSANWVHGFFFPEGENITVTDVNLPAGWIPQDSCTGASCSAQETGGVGFYYDGSNGSSCSECNPFTNDGNPSNNYGQSSMSCGTAFSIEFDMTFCNSKIETGVTDFLLRGTSDGNTGCWSSPDYNNNTVSFSVETVESVVPLFTLPAWSPEVITQCFDAGDTLNYIAVLEAECGTGDDVTWWDAPAGGNLIGTGSPFMYDPPGNQCPAGTVLYASCCPDGEGCERSPVVIGHCLPPSDVPTFDPIEPQCPDSPNPLPPTSIEGVTGTWSPAYDPFNTTTYTFLPDPGQCAVYPVSLEVEILPLITLTIPDVEPICQNATPPTLPNPLEGTPGNWVPAVIDTSIPGVFQFTFVPEDACAEDAVIEVIIEEKLSPEFVVENHYCSGTEIITLPTTSDNGLAGTWFPATVDTSQVGTVTYTFTPNAELCAEEFEVEIEVEQFILPTFATVNPICQFSTPPALPQPNELITGTWLPAVIDTNTEGIFNFTFTPDMECSEPVTIQIEITADIVPEFIIENSYCQFETPDALNTISNNGVPGTWFPATIDTNAVGVGIYTFTPDADQCSSPITLNVEIYPEPVLNTLPVQLLCDNDFDGIYLTNLSGFNGLLGGGAGVNYSYYASQADMDNNIPIPGGQLNNYTFTNLPTTIFVVGMSGQSCKSQPIAIQFDKEAQVQHAVGPFGPIEYCPEDTVDLTQFEGIISSANGVVYGYYHTLDNARTETAEILNPQNYTPTANQTSVFARLDAAGVCSAIVEIKLKRLPSPSLSVPSYSFLCDDDSFEMTLTSDDPTATFEWELSDGTIWTGATQIISETGTYIVTAYSAEGCRSESQTFTVIPPATPQIVNLDVSGNNLTVGATNNGEGPMEYSLDGVFWQNTNVFMNLIPGETYTVWVRSSGCMISKYTITILSLPNFFSPNGDGINDVWEIRGIQTTPNATLKIFDRYGKIFVDSIFEGDYVWDGKYMGRNVASGDYWYIIQIPSDGIISEKKFVGHVTVRNK